MIELAEKIIMVITGVVVNLALIAFIWWSVNEKINQKKGGRRG